ncbi:MAG: YcxB family protein [Kofleriaceae bacterium]
MISIEFDHRLDEHLRARRLYYRERSWLSRADKVVALLLLAFGVASVAVAGVQWWTLIWFALAPLEWFDLLSLEPLAVRYMFKRTAKFHERTTLSFSEEHVTYKTPSIDSTIDWRLFTGLLEDAELFLLPYEAPRTYAIVPKRAFPSEEARAEFRELVRKKVA